MDGEQISARVRAFIAEQVRSVVELECLLLLQRQPDREWTAEEMGRDLCIDSQWSESEMEDLARRGLAEVRTDSARRYRYSPRTDELRQAMQELAHDYAQRRVTIIQLIYARPNDPIQSFADAFLFRKGRSDG
ncbi:MAG TPA: hypothetical protein VHD56_10490 [Tepidisphaeraceae bacterium]|nr:hypothetical protein [Tepidisphaeraceae bacterium]